ncbi:MAG TPA: hypothetical protein VEI04_13380 [Syntrophobacteria bacterium]|nr:hypothetical protein [Syntrophobacteria bacterium]
MKRHLPVSVLLSLLLAVGGCSTAYQARPLPFKAPSAYPNAQQVAGATMAAEAFADSKRAQEAFGFDVRGAGFLPVEVVFDNQGSHPLEINGAQTFLEDAQGNLWPVLDRNTAYERATKYSQTKEIFKEGAYHGFLGAAAGALIGAAVGVVSGQNVAVAAGKGAAIGAAGGATLGGAKGYLSDEARHTITDDLRQKSLQNRPVEPRNLAYGFLFFPGEAPSARELRLQLRETDTGAVYVVTFALQ